jgi:two-component system chemotaxis response regulator CheY
MGMVPRCRSVLLVEDDYDVREALAEIIREELGRTVVEAVDGVDALAKLDQVERPCLVLLDLIMPRVDGLELLERLKDHRHAPDFFVIVMSAQGGATAAENWPNILGRLTKPFDVDELLRSLSAATTRDVQRDAAPDDPRDWNS